MRKDDLQDSLTANVEVERILTQYEPYIRKLAWRAVPRNIFPLNSLEMAVDDLTQNVLFKLWRTLKRTPIQKIEAYIKTIIYTEVINMVRQHRFTFPLPDDAEVLQDNVILIPFEGSQDPAFEFEHQEVTTECIEEIVTAILELPPIQQYTMICSLKERTYDTSLVLNELRRHGVPIESINWPHDREGKARLRASLLVARNKLRFLRDILCACK